VQASGRDVPYIVGARRAGDVADLSIDPSRANGKLGWHSSHDLEAMCTDTWRWQSKNPYGCNQM
jgi:UDP-glucose 4-epimerase